jgi:hypothetical protein
MSKLKNIADFARRASPTMTEFWVSNAKHYCKHCKVWMQGDKVSIKNHEVGKRHMVSSYHICVLQHYRLR